MDADTYDDCVEYGIDPNDPQHEDKLMIAISTRCLEEVLDQNSESIDLLAHDEEFEVLGIAGRFDEVRVDASGERILFWVDGEVVFWNHMQDGRDFDSGVVHWFQQMWNQEVT